MIISIKKYLFGFVPRILLGVVLICPPTWAAEGNSQTPRSTLARQRSQDVEVPWAEKQAFEKQSGRRWQKASLEEKKEFIQRYRRDEERRIRQEERQRRRELKGKDRTVREIHRKYTRLQRAEAKEEKDEARNFQRYQKNIKKRDRQLQKQASRPRVVRIKPVRVRQENPSNEEKK